jgi:MFS transporter, DHA2 family, multidrug resistance protein
VVAADQLPGEVGATLLDAARQAFTHGLHVTSGLSAALAVLAAVLLGRR